jgi:transcriptional regulator with XRE-family HTH domain
MRLDERLSAARDARGLAISILAKRLGLAADELKAYEDGGRDLPARLIGPLARALRVDPLELLGIQHDDGPDLESEGGRMSGLTIALSAVAGLLVGLGVGLAL